MKSPDPKKKSPTPKAKQPKKETSNKSSPSSKKSPGRASKKASKKEEASDDVNEPVAKEDSYLSNSNTIEEEKSYSSVVKDMVYDDEQEQKQN